ncbi:uncharacterized protein BDFB_009842, partial [Asbolus verrucosus]
GCLVGVVKNVTVQGCQITCFIEDHTGTIKAEVMAKLSSLNENRYAQVFGSIRYQNADKIFMIIKSIPVNDANVITCHLLQVICKRLEAESELKKQVSSANSAGEALVNALAGEDEMHTATTRITTFQEAVLNVIKTDDSEYGISKKSILRQFPSYQEHEVMLCHFSQTIEYLTREGFIYPTIDQNYLKAASN